MKRITRIISLTAAMALLASSAACTSRTAADSQETSGGDGVSEAAASDAGAESITTDPTLDMSEYSFDTVYGSQLLPFLEHQYYFNGSAVPIAESNYYFVDAFLELTNYATYGYYPATTEGYIDLSAATTAGDYDTYGDFFVDYAERMLESTLIINQMANDDGTSLSDDRAEAIDQGIESLRTTQADLAGMSLDELLAIYYGPSCTEQSFRDVLYDFYMADQYTSDFIENYDYDEDEIMVPNIRYALFYAPESGSDEETLSSQEAAANQMVEDSYNDIDVFAVKGASAQTDGTVLEYGEIAVSRNQTVQAFENWAYDESRQEGDLDVIYAPEYGYFVVGYLGKTEIDEESKNQIAVAALGETVNGYIDNDTYSFYTDDAFEAATEVTAPSVIDIELDVPELTEETQAAATGLTGNSAMDILVVVLAAIGGVAVVGVVIFGIKYIAGKNRKDILDRASFDGASEEQDEEEGITSEESSDQE